MVLLAAFKRKELSGWVLSFYIAVVSALAMFIICIAGGKLMLPHSATGWLLCLVFAIAINVGAVVLFQNGTRIVGGEKAAILSTFEPITSVVAGSLILGEIIGIRTAIGTAFVIIAGVVIALDSKH